ncbi:MAG: ABC transporter permease subunit [SAR324 cluster bacterium]|nr:ABC transporter permease subunit [SAR324 cluster bacterium]
MTLLEMRESIRARWFVVYVLIFGGAIILLFTLGITESRVLGFTGLSRLMVTYIQLCVAVLPVFILITTVRSVVGDRESNVLEYLLSFPISLGAYYWGKVLARFLVVFLPVVVALCGSALWGLFKNLEVVWNTVGYYSLLMGSLTWCFLGIGMLLSTLTRKQEWGLGMAFLVWLFLLVFIDIIMIGVMLQHQVQEQVVIGISLLNPLQTFRTATLLLFDPELSVLGPSAFVILDHLGRQGFLWFALIYPAGLGGLCSWSGYEIFRRGDLV